MRKMIHLPGSEVFHERNCPYLQYSDMEKWEFLSPRQAKRHGYRPCKYCSSVEFHLIGEKKRLNRFIIGKNMTYKFLSPAMYVKTEISCWKILYDPGQAAYIICHRNYSAKPIDFEHPDREQYHRQNDIRDAKTMEECFQYIRSHDSFRKMQQETKDRIHETNISLKYRKQRASQKRRRENRRLKALFAELEKEHPEYKELAIW